MSLHIGLDSGHTGTRRVAVEQRWGKATVVSNVSRTENVVLSASAAELTFRALSFPFADRRRLEIMVAQELEHSLGFPPGQAVWGFVARPPQPDGSDNVYVVACPRNTLERALTQAEDVKPTVVDAEPYAYQRVLALAGVRDALVADFGATHTTFCRVRDGHVDYVRALIRGGNQLDGAISQRQRMTLSAANAVKHERGLAVAEVREFFDRLVADALLPAEPVEAPIYVTGGGARTRGLTDWLSNKLQRPALAMPVPAGVDACQDAVAFGMALWGLRGTEGINLYRQETPRSVGIAAAVFAALICVFISLDVGTHEFVLNREIKMNQAAIAAIAKTAVPNGNVRTLSELQSVLASKQHGPTTTGRNVEAILLQVSKAMKDAAAKTNSKDLIVSKIQIGSNLLTLSGSAHIYPSIDAFKSAMADHFGNATVSTTRVPDGTMSFDMVCPLP